MKARRENPDDRFAWDFEAVLFDLDGVVTRTASLHAAAWQQLFGEYRERRKAEGKAAFPPFDREVDYNRYVDGKPRCEGVRSFLAARGIELPRGDPRDPPDKETVCGLGNRKNEIFHQLLQEKEVEVFPATLALIRVLRARGTKIAVVSSSRNCLAILTNAGLAGWFDIRVDGVVAQQLGLKGKPSPDIFLEAARRLGVDPRRSAVVEDALAGVQAAVKGGFSCVIAVDRHGSPHRFEGSGAHVVVADISELMPTPLENGTRAAGDHGSSGS